MALASIPRGMEKHIRNTSTNKRWGVCKKMQIDYHSHILPGMDDGALDNEISTGLMRMLAEQGIRKVYATPHYYRHEEGVDAFLLRRKKAYERIRAEADRTGIEIGLGAEVHVERDICSEREIGSLCYENSSSILLELPYTGFQHWVIEEIENITYLYQLAPVIAHFERYLKIYSAAEMQSVLELPVLTVQVNVQSLQNLRVRSWVRTLLKDNVRVILGTDCHNLSWRRPEIKGIPIDKRISDNL